MWACGRAEARRLALLEAVPRLGSVLNLWCAARAEFSGATPTGELSRRLTVPMLMAVRFPNHSRRLLPPSTASLHGGSYGPC
jgi:hypothetical protein